MTNLPTGTGTATVLFTDIKGSTKLPQEHPDKWETLRERHPAIRHGCAQWLRLPNYGRFVFD